MVPFLSQFEDVGLRDVCWKWNEIPEAAFGLTGEGCGVIAHEVKNLYPWAVLKGRDGYLRVRCDLLLEATNNHRAYTNGSAVCIHATLSSLLQLANNRRNILTKLL